MNREYIRPVTIASVCGANATPDEMFELTRQAAKQHPDLILLSECWHYRGGPVEAGIDHPMTKRIMALAKEFGVYIVHPLLMPDEDYDRNSALVIDRNGEIIGRYDKTYPYWPELVEEGKVGGNFPGALHQPVIDCDFGRIAVFICFDANFPDIWAYAAEQGAELVLWPSAYAAGRQLEAHALNNHYNIVSATSSGHCMAFDINGERIVNVRNESVYVQWITLDLDRCIFHENYNMDKLEKLLAEKPRRIEVEKHWPEEQWIIVRSAIAGVSAREVCREAGMEELRSYKLRSRDYIDNLRKNGIKKDR